MKMAATLRVGWFYLIVVTWTLALGQDTSEICPSRQYQLREGTGTSYCYLYVQSPLTYAAANRSCIRDGAILLNILSAEEDAYVKENFFFVSPNRTQEFWIGLNDIIQEGKFRWENTSVDSVLSSSNYSNWTADYALENRASRDCVKFTNDGWRVHDLPCGSSLLPFVCKSNTCSSQDGEQCVDDMTMPPPQALVSAGGISAIVIVAIVVSAVLIIVIVMLCLWKFKNDLFNRLCCFCCGGGDRSKVRNLQQENQRLRQQLSQHRLSVSGRMPPGQFTNALSGVPDGRGGVLPPIKQPVSPTNPYADDRVPFLGSSIGGGGPPPLSIQRQTGPRQIPGPFIGGRPSVTAPAGQGGLPPGILSGTTPVRPVRQSLPIFGGSPPQPPSVLGARKPVTTATLTEEEEEESESSDESEQEEGEGKGAGQEGGEGAESKPAGEAEGKPEEAKEDSASNSQQE